MRKGCITVWEVTNIYINDTLAGGSLRLSGSQALSLLSFFLNPHAPDIMAQIVQTITMNFMGQFCEIVDTSTYV
jgi:hypothetical protein